MLNVEIRISLVTLKHRASSVLDTYISDPLSKIFEVYLDYRFSEGEIGIWRTMHDSERGDRLNSEHLRR